MASLTHGRSLLLMADPAFRNIREVSVSGLATGWAVNRSARASARMRSKDAHLLGFPALLGRWIYTNTPMGPWGGYVQDLPTRIDDQTIEFAAVDFGGLLDLALTPRTFRQSSGSAGALISRAISTSNSDEPIMFSAIACDEDGAPVTIEWRGDPTGRVVQSLANGAGGLWRVEVTAAKARNFIYQAKPLDRRGSILLVEGIDVIGGSITSSLSGMVNDLLGIANDRDWQRASGARIVDPISRDLYGRRRGLKRYPGHTRRSSLETAVRADLKTLALPAGPVSLELPDSHPILWEIREGQIVRLWSCSQNRRYDLTVTGRAWDSLRGIGTIVGTVVESS